MLGYPEHRIHNSHGQLFCAICFYVILLDYCPFGRLAERLSITANDFCRIFGSEEKEEIVFHSISQCIAVTIKRCRFLSVSDLLDTSL